MSSPTDDRITYLEARIVELERAAQRRSWSLPRLSLARRLLVVGLALLLALPAGVVLASHRFSDVPTSHQFHNAIAAVADAGITSGCATNRYCPNGLVTRGQMAAFLSRLGALAPGSAPKVNAKAVNGHRIETKAVAASTPVGTRLFLDANTGADILRGGVGTLRINNTNASLVLLVTGTLIIAGELEELSVTISPGGGIQLPGNADLVIARISPDTSQTASSQLTCTYYDVAPAQLACIIIG